MKIEVLRGADLGVALEWILDGKKVRRAGWNGKEQWLELEFADHDNGMAQDFVVICGNFGRMPWLCSASDLLAEDWEIATPT